jgi:hypothetical protein
MQWANSMKKTDFRLSLVGAGFVAAGSCLLLWSIVTKYSNPPAAEFTIEKGPRLIQVPVTANGKTLSFCIDTGACKTVFDASLRPMLGAHQGRTTVAMSSGILAVDLFGCPPASVGGLDLSGIGSVACYDLTQVRQLSGKEIYGVLGMDILRNFSIEIDFDDGKLRLWKTAPASWQKKHKPVTIAYDNSNRPYVVLTLPGERPEQFMLNTGSNTSTLRDGRFEELFQHGLLIASMPYSGYATAGTLRGQTGYVSTLRLEPYSHENIRMDRDPFSAIGVRYLSRYKCRLDFPNNVAYFERGSRFSFSDPVATSGLSILQINGEKVIYSVERGGPGAAQALQSGDVILTVEGRKATECDMASLHEILTRQAGARVPLQLRRNSQPFSVTLELQNRQLMRR